MRIGELARSVGVSPDTLRHYERRGLFAPPRSEGGFREYGDAEVARVRLIRRAMGLGLSLDEISRVLRDRDAGGVPCRAVRDMVSAKLAGLDARIGQLTALRGELASTLSTWDERLAATPQGERAFLLDSASLEHTA